MSEVPLYPHPGWCTRSPGAVSKIWDVAVGSYKGISLIRRSPPPWDHDRNLGIVLP